jgi:hypothetical protein
LSSAPPEFVRDEFLAADPDCPVYGLNLACAFPFPVALEAPYTAMAKQLEALDDGVYVYPFWETHVTIMTFVNFSKHRRPSATQLAELSRFIEPIADLARDSLEKLQLTSFQLEFGPPQLSPKAAILQGDNPTGEIAGIRREMVNALKQKPELHTAFLAAGFNVPGIIHSTILRFKDIPQDPPRFKTAFTEAVKSAPSLPMTVSEILLTTETKPYMRWGEIVRRFALAG